MYLKNHGIEPAPDRRRQSTWKTFLEVHWDVPASVDSTTIEVWTKSELVTCYRLLVMEFAKRPDLLRHLTAAAVSRPFMR